MFCNIELYKEGDKYCAYIGSDNGSEYKIRECNESECARRIANYIEDYGYWEEE